MADETIVKLPSTSVLKTLISKSKTIDSKLATLKGDLGSTIADAVDTKNVHAGAFKLVRKLERMDPVKLNAFLTHFDDYRTKLELDAAAGNPLPGMGEGEQSEEEPDPDPDKPKPPMFDDKAPLPAATKVN